MDDVIHLNPKEESISELLKRLGDDVGSGKINAKGCTVVLQSENKDEEYVFEVFGWGEWVKTRADMYWSIMKAGNFVL